MRVLPWTLAALVLAALSLPVRAQEAPAMTEPPAVLLELFGSEGCSSCPPADELLDQLLDSPPVPGVRLLAMSEHVDYWDYLGWKDPFAKPAYTAHQRALVAALHIKEGLYTPMLVVDGAAACVGSDREAVLAAIATAAKRPHAKLAATLAGGNHVKVTVSALPPGMGGRMLAIEATGLRAWVESHVTWGENVGKTLRHRDVAIAPHRTVVDGRHLPIEAQIGPIERAPGGGPILIVLRTLDGTRVLGSTLIGETASPSAAPTER